MNIAEFSRDATPIFCFLRAISAGRGCSREDLNLHGLPHTVLSRTRLPFRHVSISLAADAGGRVTIPNSQPLPTFFLGLPIQAEVFEGGFVGSDAGGGDGEGLPFGAGLTRGGLLKFGQQLR